MPPIDRALMPGGFRPIDGSGVTQSLYLPPDDLVTHAVVLGMTGSGKTGLLMVLVEEAVRSSIPVVVIDIKGDLPNLLLTFPTLSFFVQGNYVLNLNVDATNTLCFFTRIQGKFRGGGEMVELYRVAQSGSYVWYAQATQGGGGSSIRGEGYCMYYHQRDH